MIVVEGKPINSQSPHKKSLPYEILTGLLSFIIYLVVGIVFIASVTLLKDELIFAFNGKVIEAEVVQKIEAPSLGSGKPQIFYRFVDDKGVMQVGVDNITDAYLNRFSEGGKVAIQLNASTNKSRVYLPLAIAMKWVVCGSGLLVTTLMFCLPLYLRKRSIRQKDEPCLVNGKVSATEQKSEPENNKKAEYACIKEDATAQKPQDDIPIALKGGGKKLPLYRKLAAVPGVILIVWMVVDTSEQGVKYKKYGKITNGHVERLWVEKHKGRRGRIHYTYSVQYSFLDEKDGARVGIGRADYSYWDGLVEGGDVSVEYLPGQGQSRIYDDSLSLNNILLFLSFPTLVFYLNAHLKKRKKRIEQYKELVSFGTKASGAITEIIGDGLWSPVQLEYEFLDSMRVRHLGTTAVLPKTIATNYKIGDSLKVFYDPQNPKKNISEIG